MKTDQTPGDVRIYGRGLLGGKGSGLVKINEQILPKANRLETWILTTEFYDRFVNRGRRLADEDLAVVASILKDIGDTPISIRSSATNEAGAPRDGCIMPVRAGENASFMLPNNHPDFSVRLRQAGQAVSYVYEDFITRQPPGSIERMAIVVNPIHGVFDDTQAGPVYYPYISGVANSFFPHALKTQDPCEGFARIAFGHGYATVLDDFPVISMVTIKNPLPPELLQIGPGQQFFYALDMTKNRYLSGEELETMSKLHVRFANYHKIKLLGIKSNVVTIEELVQRDRFGFKTGLAEIMATIAARVSSRFQIEFVFNIDFARKTEADGWFHVVQLTQLPEVKSEVADFPEHAKHTYISTRSSQGHGVRTGITYVLVVSPFVYTKEMQEEVRRGISETNRRMREDDEHYIIIVPGRLGSKNSDWGIYVDYADVDGAAGIFEYGVDIAGRPEPLPEESGTTGGTYGSHFLYMVQGGYDEEQKRLQTRMYGTQGTHFLTNIMTNNVIYGYIAPGQDTIDPWFFAECDPSGPLTLLRFPEAASIFADSVGQRCVVISYHE